LTLVPPVSIGYGRPTLVRIGRLSEQPKSSKDDKKLNENHENGTTTEFNMSIFVFRKQD